MNIDDIVKKFVRSTIVNHDDMHGPSVDEAVEAIHAAYLEWAQAREDQRVEYRENGSPLAFR